MPLAKEIGSSKGEMRKERMRVDIIDDLRKRTARCHFATVTHLVQVAQDAVGIKSDAEVTAESLEKKYKLYEKGLQAV
jgi:hypothetical protein